MSNPKSPETEKPSPEVEGASPILPKWNCDLVEDGVQLDALSVGDTFLLSCKGDYQERMTENLKIEFADEKDQYKVHILEFVRSDEQNLDLKVTSYKTGVHKDLKFVLRDGENGFQVAGVTFEVKSILKQENGPPQRMWASMIPVSLPVWIYVVLGLIAVVLLQRAYSFFKKRGQRRRMLEELQAHQLATTPYNHFTRQLRQMNRSLSLDGRPIAELIKELDLQFRMYLVRRFQVPAHLWSSTQTLRAIKGDHKLVYSTVEAQLRRCLVEFDRVPTGDSDRVKEKDFEQFAEMTLDLADRIEKSFKLNEKKSARGRLRGAST